MTPEEWATQVAVRLLEDYRDRGGDTSRILSEGGIAYMVAEAVRDAVAEEREACARVADAWVVPQRWEGTTLHGWPPAARDIAAAIRGRGGPTP